MRQYTPRVKRLRLDVFPGVHVVTYALVVRQERAGHVQEHLVKRGTIPYPTDVADLDGYDLVSAVWSKITGP